MNRKLIARKIIDKYEDTSLTENVIVSVTTGFNSKIHTISDTIEHFKYYYEVLSSSMHIIELYELTNLQYELLLVKDFLTNEFSVSGEYVTREIDDQEQLDFLCKRLGCDYFSKSKIDLLYIYNEKLNGNNNDYQDEICATDNDLLIKNKISNLQESERKFIVEFLNDNLTAPKNRTNLRVALAMSIIVITAKSYSELKKLKICANDDGSEGIFLDSGVWRRRDYVPNNSYRRLKHSIIQAPITRNVDFPLPCTLINALKSYLGNQVSIKSSNLSSVRKIWKVLKSNDKNDVILPGRKGAVSLRKLLFVDLMEASDQEVAALILSQPTLAKRHHLYYLSHKVEKTLYIWSRSIEGIFKYSDLNISQIEPKNLYHGSECVIDIENMREILNSFFASVEERKNKIKSLSKTQLINFWNDIESLRAFIYLMNIAGREVKEIGSRDEFITYYNSGTYISVLDKITPKMYKDRILPISDLNVGFLIFAKKIQFQIEDSLGISIDSNSQKSSNKCRFLRDDLSYIGLSSKLCLKQLFNNEELPCNLPRQLIATYIREVDGGIYGKYGRIYLGHECDKYNNRCYKILSEMSDIQSMVNKVNDYVFDGLIKLKVKSKKYNSIEISNAEKLSNIIRSEIHDTKSKNRVFDHINKKGSVDLINNSHCIELQDDHLYIINDEIKVLIDDVYRNDIKLAKDLCVAKDVNPLSFMHSHRMLSSLANNLSYSQYKSFGKKSANCSDIDNIQSSLISKVQSYDELSSIYELISKFNHKSVCNHRKQYQVLRMHISFNMSKFGIEPISGNLLSLIEQSKECFSEFEVYILYFCYHLISTGKNGDGILGKTVSEYLSIVANYISHFIEKESIEIDEIIESPCELNDYFLDFLQNKLEVDGKSENYKNKVYSVCKRFIDFISNGSVKFNDRTYKVQTTSSLTTPSEFYQLIRLIDESPTIPSHLKIEYKSIAIIMYRFGLRVGEVISLFISDIKDGCKLIYIHSRPFEKLKSGSGNRICNQNGLLSEIDEKILCLAIKNAQLNNRDKLISSDLNVNVLRCIIKLATSDNKRTLHSLRHSYANFTLLVILNVNTPIVRDYYSSDEFKAIRCALFRNLTYSNYPEFALFALSKSMGHSSIDTTFRHYIHVQDYAYRYHNLGPKYLTLREISTSSDIDYAVYRKRRNRRLKDGVFTALANETNYEKFNYYCNESDIEYMSNHELISESISIVNLKFIKFVNSREYLDEITFLKDFGLLDNSRDINSNYLHEIVINNKLHNILSSIINDFPNKEILSKMVNLWKLCTASDGLIIKLVDSYFVENFELIDWMNMELKGGKLYQKTNGKLVNKKIAVLMVVLEQFIRTKYGN